MNKNSSKSSNKVFERFIKLLTDGKSSIFYYKKFKESAKNNFFLTDEENIIYAKSTAFWDNDKKITQGIVITDLSITIVDNNNRPDNYLKFYWKDIENFKYKDSIGSHDFRKDEDFRYCSFYIEANLYCYDGKNINEHISFPFFLVAERFLSASKWKEVEEALNQIVQFYKQNEIKQNIISKIQEEHETSEQEIFNNISELTNNKKYDEAEKIIEQMDKNSWLYHICKADIYISRDNDEQKFLNELKQAKDIIDNKLQNNENVPDFEVWTTYNSEVLLDLARGKLRSAKTNLFYLQNLGFNTEDLNNEINDFIAGEDFLKEVPYKDRKIIMPIKKEYIRNSDNFIMVDIDNMPKNIILPFGHPKECELYIGHPFLPNKYFPIENHELEFTEDKIREFCDFVEMLGATEVYAESISYIGEGGKKQQEKITGGNIGYKCIGIEGEHNSKNNTEFENKLNKMIKIHEKFIPKSLPKLLENLHWYKYEESWQRLYEKRMRGSLIEHSEIISTGQSSMVQESENININGELKILGGKLASLGARYNTLKKREYHQNKDVQIVLHVKFAPLESLK